MNIPENKNGTRDFYSINIAPSLIVLIYLSNLPSRELIESAKSEIVFLRKIVGF